jgi:hypothetical protein
MLRYAPPIYTVIRIGIIFVIFIILYFLISVFILFIILFLPSLIMYPTVGFASTV